MSGILALVQQCGTPLDRALLERMNATQLFRGPDAQAVWCEGGVGLGHTLLITTEEAQRERQPASLDGQVWITSDARVDGREALRKALRAAGRHIAEDSTDDLLILHAYRVWGEDCVLHLIGDFAFVIWDGAQQRLFAARDHFGVKPLFFAQTASCLILSNSLNCVRAHPAVSDRLDDLAIADFLLFGSAQEPDASAFADIRRLPNAHALSWSAGQGLRSWRYWSLPTFEAAPERSPQEWVDDFTAVLDEAVADRLRTRCVGIEMSGGMDSCSMAATARKLLERQPEPFDLHAQCIVWDRVIPDRERHFADLAAQHLDIPIRFVVGEDHPLFAPGAGTTHRPPEPVPSLQPSMSETYFAQAEAMGRVWLTGWDGDALMSESIRPLLRRLWQQGHHGRWLQALLRFGFHQRGLLAGAARDRLFRWWGRRGALPADATGLPGDGFPDWINPELVARLQLRERFQALSSWKRAEHPTRPYAHTMFQRMAEDSLMFQNYDAADTGRAVEYRHPLMDLRVIDFCLTLPLQPWAVKKHILREAMRSLLPDAVRLRPKSPLAGAPHELLLRQQGAPHSALSEDDDRLLMEYINKCKVTQNASFAGGELQKTRALTLQDWLRQFH